MKVQGKGYRGSERGYQECTSGIPLLTMRGGGGGGDEEETDYTSIRNADLIAGAMLAIGVVRKLNC